MQRSCIAILLSFFLASCSFTVTPNSTNFMVEKAQAVHEQVQIGLASWYGPGFHGRRTANRERFNQNALTAAHRELPFGAEVLVTNPANGKSVKVRINDRGPFVKGRIIDLSKAAASRIGVGVSPVEIRILKMPS